MATKLPPLPQLSEIPPELLSWLRTVEAILRELQESN